MKTAIRSIKRIIKQAVTPSSVMNDSGVRLHFNRSDPRGQWLRSAGGAFDVEAIRSWKFIVEKLEPLTVLDIGANYGEVTLSKVSSASIRHIYFEPNPKVARKLRKTIAALGPKHTVLSLALSNAAGSAHLDVSNASSGKAKLLQSNRTCSHPEVEVRTADDVLLADTLAVPVAFKIDVEGHELLVVEGMQELLALWDMWFGLIEFNDPALLDRFQYCYFLSDTGVLIRVTSLDQCKALSTAASVKDLIVASHPLDANGAVVE